MGLLPGSCVGMGCFWSLGGWGLLLEPWSGGLALGQRSASGPTAEFRDGGPFTSSWTGVGPWAHRTSPGLQLRGAGTASQAASGSTAGIEVFRLVSLEMDKHVSCCIFGRQNFPWTVAELQVTSRSIPGTKISRHWLAWLFLAHLVDGAGGRTKSQEGFI